MNDNLIERVLKTVRNYDMLEPGRVVLAAVSGGPDSVFLLYVLSRLKNKLGMKDIVVCNMDHGLRAKESSGDSSFVRDLAAKMGLKYIHRRINLRKSIPEGLSTEEAAREARYEFFLSSARKAHAAVIATGHTLDDQAETILMRFVKGASLKGIVGISPVRREGRFSIIRPLLELSKDEIRQYLDQENIAYRIDSTNLEPIYFRNVVRKEIIPFLEKYNPGLKRSLFNLAEHLREDFEFIREMKDKARGARKRKGAVEIKLKDIVIQPRALQKEILRDLLESSGGKVKGLSFRHWKEMEALIRRKQKGSSVDLPGGIRITRTRDTLTFAHI